MQRVLSVILIAAACGCTTESQIPLQREGQAPPSPQYVVVKLPASLGGTVSRGTAISDRGWVAGFSNLADNVTRHAAVWRDGSITDLGTLAGPGCAGCNSSVVWPGLNNQGAVVGISETAAIDPLNEQWSCTAFFATVTGHLCQGFVWQNGVMTPLPTLGGNQGFATGVNSRGQVVGWAETPVRDPTCNTPQVLQFRAVLWDTRSGAMQQLAPYPGDSTSAATAINENGQAVGISGACDVAVGEFSARHAVLWDHGTVTDLGNLGGVAWNTPMAISESGTVVGFSDPAGDADGSFLAHAFLWTRQGGIRDLKTLPGDALSEALAVNSRGQVVGVSFGGTKGSRAFLWQDGVMRDFNELVGPGNLDVFQSAQAINEAGQITGRVRDHVTGAVVTFVATPVGGQ